MDNYKNKVLMFYLSYCPYCKKAQEYIDNILIEFPQYRQVEYVKIDEAKEVEFANSFDYNKVPTFYFNGAKQCEGILTYNDVLQVFTNAYDKINK